MVVKMYNALLVGNVTMGFIQCFCWKLNSQLQQYLNYVLVMVPITDEVTAMYNFKKL